MEREPQTVGGCDGLFTETARICGSYRGNAVEWSVQEFCAIIDSGGPAEKLEARVVGIEYADNAGMAWLEARNWRGTRYGASDAFARTGVERWEFARG
jgi:hypothetical protein